MGENERVSDSGDVAHELEGDCGRLLEELLVEARLVESKRLLLPLCGGREIVRLRSGESLAIVSTGD
eukprot:SAG31_NODE_11805_length_996_cov_3.198439_1_plen_67_part_00